MLLGPTQVLPCGICSPCYQDIDDLDAMLSVEEWQSRTDLEGHVASEKYRIILSLMDFSVKLSEIKFNTVSRAEGSEFVEVVRA